MLPYSAQHDRVKTNMMFHLEAHVVIFNTIVFNYVLFLRSVIKNKNLRKFRRFDFL